MQAAYHKITALCYNKCVFGTLKPGRRAGGITMDTPEKAGEKQERITQEFQSLLDSTPHLTQFLEEQADNMQPPSFSQHLKILMEKLELTPAKLGELSLLSRSFTYQLCSGVRAPSRDVVLRLALVLKLDLDETQRLLRTACRGALYPRLRRDAVFIFALRQGLNLYDTNELLCSLEEAPLL